MNAPKVETPNYVLLQSKQQLAPKLLASQSGQVCIAIYGFSDKPPYDAFCEKSDLELMPYPLVKGQLKNRLEVAGDTTLIIAIDAAGPDDPILNAATMQSVLDALEKQSRQVSVTHRLTKDERTHAYRVEECGSVSPSQLQR